MKYISSKKFALNCSAGHIAYKRCFPMFLRRQPSGGCRFNPDCRQVTKREYLTPVPGYG